ncbi:glutamyl-tRNA synthetase-like protein [Chaetomium strumarium]|uniref:Glutamate--tRNA ligase, mitochondrial n=1 Tax=Chaetomium strumarium TaxID=1170767 RepID=A0AAJ0GLU3_9PEZI|nr:glutamyl-tRNA synthetase-like protein [Chaetomium strumarium]
MEKIAPRSRSVLHRRLHSARAQHGAFAFRQRLSFSSCSPRLANKQLPKPGDRFKLPGASCRTRFAPSPTGYLHLGSLRTALFNYLLARATGGRFVLRIEDTDQTRRVADAEEKLYQDLRWVGLSWDEGPDREGPYGPYRQSERLPLYKEHADELLREGKAYRCFCSPEELEQHKRTAHESGQPTLYPGTCRNLSLDESDERAHNGEPFAIRFKSSEAPPLVKDIVYRRFQNKYPEDDYVIIKRDGFPTYHFANVVDDRHMKITHVVRGAEWLISTPKHVDLYNAFGWEPPQFAHLGLLVDEKRQKLSKRDNSANIAWYREQLFLPSALLNFTVLLGSRGKGGSDIMTLQDMVDNFSLKFSKGDIVVPTSKIPFLQGKHVERLVREGEDQTSAGPLIKACIVDPIKAQIDAVEKAKDEGLTMAPGGIETAYIGRQLPTIHLLEERFHKDLVDTLGFLAPGPETPKERIERSVSKLRYFFWEIPERVLEIILREKGPVEPVIPRNEPGKVGEALACMTEKIRAVDESDWNRDVLGKLLSEMTQGDKKEWERRFGRADEALDVRSLVYKTIRWALQGMQKGPPIPPIMEILGREETLRRLEAAKLVAEGLAAQVDGTAATQSAASVGGLESGQI